MKQLIIGEKGFTFAEIIVVFGVVAMLFGLAYSSTMKAQQSTSLESAVLILVSDIKNQQTNTMMGFTLGGLSASEYGVHFELDSYTLFKGTTYNPSEQTNLVIDLPTNISFSNLTFPNSTILFSKGSGEVSNYVSGSDTITLLSNLSKSRTLRINKLGAIISQN